MGPGCVFNRRNIMKLTSLNDIDKMKLTDVSCANPVIVLVALTWVRCKRLLTIRPVRLWPIFRLC
jgi:hypothetical protein